MPYTQSHYWKIEVYNPVNNEIIQSSNHSTINEIFEKYPKINLSTWRNIAMGRSKVYNKFIKVIKLPKTPNNIENVADVETQPIIVSFD